MREGRTMPTKKPDGEMSDYEWLTSKGLCHKCRHEKVAPGRKFCFDCLDKIREDNAKRYDPEYAHNYQSRRREIYQEKKEAGICIRCNKPAKYGMYCYECYLKVKRHNTKTAERRKRERHERGLVPDKRRENGLCLWCGDPAAKDVLCCERHRQIFIDAAFKAYQANLKNGNNPWINEVEAWKKRHNWKSSKPI